MKQQNLLITIVLLLSSMAMAQQNLIPNSSFETRKGRNPTNWYFDPYLSYERSTDAHTGTYSAKAYPTGYTFMLVDDKVLQNVVDIEADAEYEFAYWYKGKLLNNNDVITKNIIVTFNWYKDNATTPTKTDTRTLETVETSETEWKQKVFSVTSPAGVSKFGVSFRLNEGRGYVLIDDVSLVLKNKNSAEKPQVPTGFTTVSYQREVELKWDKEADAEIQWDILVDEKEPAIRVTENQFVIAKLEPASLHTVRIRAVKGNSYSDYTSLEQVFTSRLSRTKDDVTRVPYLRTLGLDGVASQTIPLYYNDLANGKATITYAIDGVAVTPNGDQLTFPKTGKQTLNINIVEEQGYEWYLEYDLDIR